MALLWCHGFDNCNDVDDLHTVFDLVEHETYNAVSATTRRGVGKSVYAYYYNQSHLLKTLPVEKSTVVVGFAFRTTKMPTTNLDVIKFLTVNGLQCMINITSDGKIRLIRGTTELEASAAGVIAIDTWYYIEAKVVFHNTTGSFIVKVDGVEKLNTSSVGTCQQAATATCGAILFNSINPTATPGEGSFFDDIYIDDSDFHGDCIVESIAVNGAGSHADFTPSAGSNYENVDEATQDDDTTYNETNVVNEIDSFAMGSLASTATTIYGVMVEAIVRKTDAGSAQAIKLLCRSGGTDYLSSSDLYLGTSFKSYFGIWETNPADSAAWEDADIAAMECGVKATDV